MSANQSNSDPKQNERVKGLEVEMGYMKDLVKDMNTAITKDLPKMVKNGFDSLRGDMKEQHTEDMEIILNRLDKQDEKFAKLRTIFFFQEHPWIVGVIALSISIIFISDLRHPFMNAVFSVLGVDLQL
jgi:hypothetical protein